jgi:4-amino-4-deoxy-L-arabinose transferase-like glycosyltransferase
MMRQTTDSHLPDPLLPALLIGAVALLPRALGLDDFITTDEAYHWVERSERFAQALAEGRWADTLLTGHPGVLTMWLGSLGLLLERLSGMASGAAPAEVTHLAWLRLPGALLHALTIVCGMLLLRRLVGPRTALIAAGLWAASPYLIAHARLLHLDANLTDCVTMSMLLLLAARGQDGAAVPAHAGIDLRWLAASGAVAGLALLTKGPALILLPCVGLAMAALLAAQQGGQIWGRAQIMRVVGRSLGAYMLWLACALAVVALLWPALWADPGRALARYWGEIASNGGRPNGDGQFFLGRAEADPGPLFYPVADLFRATPLTLLGLALATIAGALALRRQGAAALESQRARALLVLLGFVIFWTLVMSLGPKKFDRYVLPTWPALLVLAAAGIDAIVGRIPRASLRSLAIGLGLAAELIGAAWYHPYYLSYYNPLLGGGPMAQRTFLIGWGEGMDQVGAYLRTRPDLGYGPVLSALGPTLQPFVPVDVRDVEDFGKLPANYAVVYLESIQRAANPALYAQLQTTVPLHTVRIHGIDYAQIYQLPRPYARALDAQFGAALRLRGVTVERSTTQIALTPAWDVRAQPGADYNLFVHLLNDQGARVAQINIAPGGGDAPATSAWEAGQQIAVPLPIDLPPGLPPGDYQLVLGVYEQASGARLPLIVGVMADPALAGPHALLVERITLP